jgi:preprotein translocase subunit SecF
MRFFDKTNINFVGPRKLFFLASAAFIIVGIILISTYLPPVLGIDFTGGTEVAVRFEKVLKDGSTRSGDIKIEQIRSAIESAGLSGSEIKSFGKADDYLVRVQTTDEASDKVNTALETAFPNTQFTTLKDDTIQPKIGSELMWQALQAVFLSVLFILMYIAFRFEFVFGLGAIVALVHDVVVTFIIIVIAQRFGLNLEINQTILAAMLTVVGYSINDTVIIFDRIRENKELYKGKTFVSMVNTSINETLSRTVNTVMTTFLVLITLVILGGPVLEGFAFTMLVGIITGTYSSIYIASSFVIWYNGNVKKIDVEGSSIKSENAKIRAAKA